MSDIKFEEFMKKEQRTYEDYLEHNSLYFKTPEEIKSTHVGSSSELSRKLIRSRHYHEKLGVIYRYLGEKDKSKQMFNYFTTFNVSTSRIPETFSEEGKKDTRLICSLGKDQIRDGARFFFAGRNVNEINQILIWAAENCFLSEDFIGKQIKAENFNDIAVAFLWRGYALTCLGEYREAYELLSQVVPYFHKYKMSGGEVWQTLEYALPKALVPLCEYKLDPTQENLIKAKDGLEAYIHSFKEPKDRLEGYLYYFHLKEKFSEVYSLDEVPMKSSVKPPTVEPAKLPTFLESEERGAVVVCDSEFAFLEPFGSNKELEDYVKKVNGLAEYPELTKLLEAYATEGELDANLLVKECKHLLKRRDAGTWLKEKTKIILAVAEDALKQKMQVRLYFDPEWELT